MAKNELEPGRVGVVRGGMYDGKGYQVRRVNEAQGYVEVMIAGKIVRLKIDRVRYE